MSRADQPIERRKERAALWSIGASAAITLAKGAAGLATGSLALISDAAHSLLDVASTTITWLAVRAATSPRTRSTNTVTARWSRLPRWSQTAFLFLLSGAVAYEGVAPARRGETNVSPSWTAAGVLVAAIAGGRLALVGS